MKRTLEICVQNIQSVDAAELAGADRVELCSGLELGGLTPSLALTEMTLEGFSGKTFVLLRPRPGHFIYSKREIQLIARDAAAIAKLGVQGVVFGALDATYKLDIYALQVVREAVPELDFTFHRALDIASNPEEMIEKLIELRIPRVLTSGAAPSAIEAFPRLCNWVAQYGDEIEFLIGGGVRSSNILQLIDTGAKEFHLSAQIQYESTRSKDLIPGDYRSSSLDEIKKCRDILNAGI